MLKVNNRSTRTKYEIFQDAGLMLDTLRGVILLLILINNILNIFSVYSFFFDG